MKFFLLIFLGFYQVYAYASLNYPIDAEKSQIVIYVYKEGWMSAVGHNHVLQVQKLDGHFEDAAHGNAKLRFALADMRLDDGQARKQAGEAFSSSLDKAAKESTRTNMLGVHCLQADHYPFVEISAEMLSEKQARLAVTLHGVTRSYELPVQIVVNKTTLSAAGQLNILQSDFNIKPFSVMAGALRVKDALQIQFILFAKRE